jgi:DNA-binding CsgD family transcriptional regulator
MFPSVRADVMGIVDAVATAKSRGDYERPLFELLEREIGFDIAFCVRRDGIGLHAPGFDPEVRRRISHRLEFCAREYAEIKERALRGSGVAVDAEFFSRAELERTQTYREIIQPHRGRASLLLFLPDMTLVLGRTRSGFRPAECQRLAALRSLVAVCEQALAARLPLAAPAPQLSPRERELLAYLRLGYTNREIASACGTSFRTVRNQLGPLFAKLEVTTRAEAVARSFELSLTA